MIEAVCSWSYQLVEGWFRVNAVVSSYVISLHLQPTHSFITQISLVNIIYIALEVIDPCKCCYLPSYDDFSRFLQMTNIDGSDVAIETFVIQEEKHSLQYI